MQYLAERDQRVPREGIKPEIPQEKGFAHSMEKCSKRSAMRILIDECLDWRLGRALTGHDCVSAQKMGWGGIKNGKLLALAQEEFDVFLTADRNLSFQHPF